MDRQGGPEAAVGTVIEFGAMRHRAVLRRSRVTMASVVAASVIALSALSQAGARAQGAATPPATGSRPATPPDRDYLVYVASEGNDHIALVRYGPAGARVERDRRIGTNPTELVGPHGLGVSPDGKFYYVSTAHGTPFGALWKYATDGDSLAGRVVLGMFPATLQVSPDGEFVYVVNFNLYGDPVTSTVSVVYADKMVEVARIPTCVMPHGSRLNAQGTKHYSACMMNDALVEIDTHTLSVARHFVLTRGSEHGAPGGLPQVAMDGHAMGGHATDGHGTTSAAAGSTACTPTWAQPSPDGARVYVACNKANDIAEVDVATWAMTRRMPAGDGVYNLAITHDGRILVGTNKRGQSVSVIDVASGKEVARIPTTRKVPSGVVISPDDRYAFVTDEGVGSQPGTVDVIDLRALTKVASVDVGQQAGGIDVWQGMAAR